MAVPCEGKMYHTNVQVEMPLNSSEVTYWGFWGRNQLKPLNQGGTLDCQQHDEYICDISAIVSTCNKCGTVKQSLRPN